MTRYIAASILAVIAAATTFSLRSVDIDIDWSASSLLSHSGELQTQVRNRTSPR